MSERPRILYITHRVPYPPDKGDRIRNWNVLKQLSRHADVTLASLNDETVAAETENNLKGQCCRVEIARIPRTMKWGNLFLAGLGLSSFSEAAFTHSSLKRLIEDWHARAPFDAFVVSASSVSWYVRTLARRNIPAFIDVVDVDSQKWLDFAVDAAWPRNWLYRWEWRNMDRVERDLIEWANTVTLVSDAERDLFNRIVGKDVAITATNGVDLEYFQPVRSASKKDDLSLLALRTGKPILAFAGAMDYLPNVDAATWFVKEVLPAILAKHPDAEFRIVGRSPTAAVKALASKNVIVTGSIPDVRPYFADASIAVVPMRLSRGLQNKVLEALAMGKATIASPPALAALNTIDGRDLVKAESPQQWIESILSLLDNPVRREELGTSGRKYVETHHDWATCLKPLIDRVLAACEVRR